ncbi:hypothetical protein BY996DRAFT_4593308, partial [Phakopsora pachyrhizi]
LQQHMESSFKIKWIIKLDRTVRIKITRNNEEINLNQTLLAQQVITRSLYPVLTNNIKITNVQQENDKTLFQHNIGNLVYLASGTRPEIKFAINYLAFYSMSPLLQFWELLDHC